MNNEIFKQIEPIFACEKQVYFCTQRRFCHFSFQAMTSNRTSSSSDDEIEVVGEKNDGVAASFGEFGQLYKHYVR